MSVPSVSRALGLNSKKNWTIRGCCAVTGEGLENVLVDAGDIIRRNEVENKKKYQMIKT